MICRLWTDEEKLEAIRRDSERVAMRAHWESLAAQREARRAAAHQKEQAEFWTNIINRKYFPEAIQCRVPLSAVRSADADTAVPSSITWMPAGRHEISASRAGGGSWQGAVVCDETGCTAVQKDFSRSLLDGRPVWIDRDHDDGEAAGWVRSFSWEPGVGIVAKIDWTQWGAELLSQRRYISFSPAFYVDRDSGRVAGLIEGKAAGGLVNAPAFGAAMRIVASASTDEPWSHITLEATRIKAELESLKQH